MTEVDQAILAEAPILPTGEPTMTHAEHERLMGEFRSKVRHEAMEMARRNNLCAVVEETLGRVGIGNVRKRIQVKATLTRTVVVEVPEDLLAGIDEAARDKVVKDVLTGKGFPGRAWQQARIITDHTGNPVNIEITEQDLPVGSAPTGYVRRYAGHDGKVAHFVPEASLEQGDHTVTLCGRFASRGTPMNWPERTMRSRRQPDRNCQRCSEVAARMSAA